MLLSQTVVEPASQQQPAAPRLQTTSRQTNPAKTQRPARSYPGIPARLPESFVFHQTKTGWTVITSAARHLNDLTLFPYRLAWEFLFTLYLFCVYKRLFGVVQAAVRPQIPLQKIIANDGIA